jgi:hypothetical protein
MNILWLIFTAFQTFGLPKFQTFNHEKPKSKALLYKLDLWPQLKNVFSWLLMCLPCYSISPKPMWRGGGVEEERKADVE